MQVDHVVEQRFILNHPRVTGYEMDRNAIHCALVPANAVVAGILKNAGGPFYYVHQAKTEMMRQAPAVAFAAGLRQTNR